MQNWAIYDNEFMLIKKSKHDWDYILQREK